MKLNIYKIKHQSESSTTTLGLIKYETPIVKLFEINSTFPSD